MILITGAAGFIGSCVAAGYNEAGVRNLVLCDDFSREDKNPNYADKDYQTLVDRNHLFNWLEENQPSLTGVIHLGARTDTSEQDWELFKRLNLGYSQRIWNYCTQHEIPLIYASSAATYGDGTRGFGDDPAMMDRLMPMNPYGRSKHEFDLWVSEQENTPPYWAGLKFFNVYGPNEYHKGRMASVVFHAFHQIRKTGELKLFRSHRPDFADGEQMRDFIYVMDVVRVIKFLMNCGKNSGIYNLGTGVARYFNDLGKQVFLSMGLEPNIRYIDTPEDIRDSYQYFTEAEMSRFRTTGFAEEFTPLEAGIDEYVRGFLMRGKFF